MKCTSQCLYRVIILLLRLSHKQFFGLRYERHRGSKWFRGLNNFDFLAPPILLFGHGCILVTYQTLWLMMFIISGTYLKASPFYINQNFVFNSNRCTSKQV